MLDNWASKKILVTGGTGFIGRHVCHKLFKAGCQPFIFTRRTITNSWLNPVAKTQVIKIDLLDEKAVAEWFEAVRPEIVLHLAGTTGRGDDTGTLCYRLNFAATVNLLKSAAKNACQRVVLLGSADEYGAQAGRQHERLSPQPISAYAVSKAEAAQFALEKYRESDLPSVVLRLFSVYGAGQPASMFVAEAIECAAGGKVFEMTTGTQKRDLIFVEDAAKAIVQAALAPDVAGKIINIGSGTATALREVAQLIWSLTGADGNLLKIGARTATEAETHDTWADISLARELLGWQPETALADGLRRTIQDQSLTNRNNIQQV